MAVQIEAQVLCVHGEGDRDTRKRYAEFEKQTLLKSYAAAGQQITPEMTQPVDPDPDVTLILRDGPQHIRLEIPLTSWDDVEAAKQVVGWDDERKQFKTGATVKITIGDPSPTPAPSMEATPAAPAK